MAFSSLLQQLLLAALLCISVLAQSADQQHASAQQVQVRATDDFNFPGCVSDCVGGSGCGTNNAQCMCKAARGNLLEAVVTCMSKHCTSQIATAKTDFLAIMVTDCAQQGLPIPSTKIQSAQVLADELAADAGSSSPTTSATPTAKMASTAILRKPSTTTAPAVQSSSSPARSSASSAVQSSANRQGPVESTTEEADATTSSEAEAAPSTTLDAAPTSKPAAKTDVQKSTTTTKAAKTDPTDTTPFGASRGSVVAPAGWLSITAPLLVAIISLA